MNISSKYQIFGNIDPKETLKKLEQCDWNAWTKRQEIHYHHKDTKSIPMVWSNHDLDNLNPITFDENLRLFEPELLDIAEMVNNFYGKKHSFVKAMFVNLPGRQIIPSHKDIGSAFRQSHRVHWCVSGDFYRLVFDIDGSRAPMETGRLIEINNLRKHGVYSFSEVDRIHLITDLI